MTPYQLESATGRLGAGTTTGELDFSPVPRGKLLIIEFVSVLAKVPVGSQQAVYAMLEVVGQLDNPQHNVVTHFLGDTTTQRHFPYSAEFDAVALNCACRAYVIANFSPRIFAVRDPTNGEVGFSAMISGHLIDA